MTERQALAVPVDANGNLTQKTANGSVWAYTWNAENQLTRVTKDSAEVATFAYDAKGRRVEKLAGGVTYAYAYDGEDIIREGRTGGTAFKYVHGTGTDEPLAREDETPALTYYHADILRSVLKETSQAGIIVHEYRYDSWGQIEAGTAESGYAFTSREADPETGLYYYRARYYDPETAVFLSPDPQGFRADVNFYRYVYSNPVRFTDPFGLQGVELCFRQMENVSSDKIRIPHPVVRPLSGGCTGYGFGPKSHSPQTFAKLAAGGYVPGQVERENVCDSSGNVSPRYQCSLYSDSSCVETCTIRLAELEANATYQFPYKLGKPEDGGFQCNDWAESIINACRRDCARSGQ